MRMRGAPKHPWAVSVQEAFRIQEELVAELVLDDVGGEPHTFGGVDVAFDRRRDLLYAAIVVLDPGSLEATEVSWASMKPTFPYVPGLLSFREGPVVCAAWEKLGTRPDLLFFDGQGIAHPRGLGLASHMGILLERPSIGCAKSRLVGEFKEPKQKRGSMRSLLVKRRKVGVVLRTKDNTRPLFVSPGHAVTIETAAARVLETCRGYRLPEPTRLAHNAAARAKRGELGPGD
ncbi:MAG: deoxyribonuclease V [Candidatus Eisenbacteria bacterium]|nr:deoxyribonuclease V [Candidatus Eisenbacteria bacterium]